MSKNLDWDTTTLIYLINEQDGITEYGGQNVLFSTRKKGFYLVIHRKKNKDGVGAKTQKSISD